MKVARAHHRTPERNARRNPPVPPQADQLLDQALERKRGKDIVESEIAAVSSKRLRKKRFKINATKERKIQAMRTFDNW